MADHIDEVRGTFEAAEKVPPSALLDSVPREGGAPPEINETRQDTGLPPGFPVQPLGMATGKFRFLTARGELAELSAGAMTNRANLVALIAGADDPLAHLAVIAKPKRRDQGFNAAVAADVLMQACSALPLYDPTTPMRHFGTWRGGTDAPVVHLGEQVLASAEENKKGRMIARALYPAVPSRAAPADEPASADDLAWVRTRFQRYWNWAGERDADVVIGWIGQAALGQYPSWRTHMYMKGKHGSGKSTVTRIVSSLLGGMSTGVKNSTSAAAIRQTTNHMAVARVFDEAEAEENGGIGDVVALFRLMSDAEGAQIERGTSDHSGVRFELFGAGFLSSIIPAVMTSADRSRFVVLTIGERDSTDDPALQALWLDELQRDAIDLGAGVWRRMLALAPARWDPTFRIYNGLVQGLGARARSGDTIGAILTGWDLMLHDAPLVDPDTKKPDLNRMEEAKIIAQPLIDFAREADEEGEGESCLRTIYAGLLDKAHGGRITVAELIDRMQEQPGDPEPLDNRLLGRLGLRLLPGPSGHHDMFIANGKNPLLDRTLANTRWRGGGHRAALDTISDVSPSPVPMRVGGRAVRGMIVPARLLPGYEDKPAEPGTDHEKV